MESIVNIMTPHRNPAAYTLIVLVLVIVIKELLSRYVNKVGNETNSHGVKADAFHHRSDAITSAAAFIGISIALIGGKGYQNADDYAALIASSIISSFFPFLLLKSFTPSPNQINVFLFPFGSVSSKSYLLFVTFLTITRVLSERVKRMLSSFAIFFSCHKYYPNKQCAVVFILV